MITYVAGYIENRTSSEVVMTQYLLTECTAQEDFEAQRPMPIIMQLLL